MISELKAIGTDIEKAIFNGFSSHIKGLKLYLCVLHLQKNDRIKLKDMKATPNAINKIIADIYGRHYGGVKELGLADSMNPKELTKRITNLKKIWDDLCPGFHDCFVKNRKQQFETNVIESAREGSSVQGLFYNQWNRIPTF